MRWLTEVLWPRVRRAFQGWQEDDGGMLAAAMAYYALLSLFPILLILIATVGFLLRLSPGVQSARKTLLELAAQSTSPAVAENIADVLEQVRLHAGLGGPLGLATLVLAAIGIFSQLETSFDRIWKVRGSPWKGVGGAVLNALVHRLRAFLMLLGVVLVVVAAFVAGIVLSAVRSYTSDLQGGHLLWNVAETSASLVLSWSLLAVVYKVIPRTRVRWGAAMQGAAVASVLWEINRRFLAAFVIGEKYTAYGVVGSIIALLLWTYLASSILFLGAEYARVVQTEGK